MADHDDLKNPEPHAAPTKTLTDKVIELALSAGGGAVTLVSGLLAAALIMYSGYVLYDTFATERAASSSAWDLLQYRPEILENPEASLDPSALAAINSDYRAWLTVYDTAIDYPVVQGKDDYYYAYHDIYGESSLTGAIYLAAGNSPDFSDDYNLVYGHHMDNGAMFGGLDHMSGSETGVIIAGNMIYDVKFFAVVNTDAYEHRIYNVGDRMNDVLDFLRSGGEGGVGVGTEVIYFNEEAAADAEKLIALSTCFDVTTSGRRVVIGKMTPRVITKEVTVTKAWEDNNDQDGIRPSSIAVTANDGTRAVLKAEENWTVTLTLPKYDNAGEIRYTWTEDAVPEGYKLTGNKTEGDSTTLTNTHEPAVTEATVKKVWNDGEDQDGIRPASLAVTLSNGTPVTLSEDNGWTATVTDLPKNAGGVPIEYAWTEAETEGYTLTDTFVDGTVTTLTNTHEPAVTEATVKKVWNDANDQDGIRPASLAVTLSDGTEVTLSPENNWTATVPSLPVNAGGKPIEYTWTEAGIEGYTLTGTSVNGTVTTLTNTHDPAVKTVTVTKVWDDADDQDSIRPGAITVTLNADGEAMRTVTLYEAEGWSVTVEDLDVYAAGKEIAYTWTEDRVPDGYALTGIVTNGDRTTVTNRHDTDTTVATVVKVWDDDNNRDGLRPDGVTMVLYADEQPAAGIDPVILNEGNGWTATLNGLQMNADGKEIVYTWQEIPVPDGYAADIKRDGTVTTVTNKHIPDKADQTVTKVWDDNNDQDGIRPDSVRATLLADGEFVTEVTLDETGEWSAAVKDLPVNAGGKAIAYTWTEDVPEGYQAKVSAGETAGTAVITNTHTPETATLTLKKVWNDDNNRDGVRPASVKATLYADWEEAARLTLTKENNWTASTGPLPVYAGGKAIEYTWEEDAGPYYDLTGIDTADGVTTLTNTHTPETVTVSVQKVWNDDEDRDRMRPSSVTVRLVADGTEFTRVSLNQAGGWSASFEGLYKNTDGKPIAYTWSEDPVTGYECASSPDKDGDPYRTVLTNTHEIAKVTLTVEKVWDDDNDRDAKRPSALTVTLYADGKEVRTEELTAENDWKAEIEVPANEKGEPIRYTWEEKGVQFYTLGGMETVGTGTVITNIHVPALTRRTVVKEWDDNNDQDGIRPKSVSVWLMADGEHLQEIVLNEENGWTYTADNLYVYDQGRSIIYSWDEIQPEGYDRPHYSSNANITTIINKHESEKQTLSVAKVWDDCNDQDGIRPSSLPVTLLADGEKVGTVTLDAGNGWTGSVADLPVNAVGKAIAYTWDEGNVEGYSLSGSVTGGTNTVLTNTHKTEVTVATVTKVWLDDDNRDGIRPASVIMTLSNGTQVTLDENNNWTATAENLPKYKDGQEIAYTWTEGAIEGYEQTGSDTVGTVTTITNTHSIETTSATVAKVWDDDNDRDGIRPASVVMTLSDGTKVTLDESNNWTATVDGLPKNMDGQEIAYTWTEDAVEGYEQTGSETVGTVTTVTNTHAAAKQNLSVTKVWDDGSDQDGVRPASLTVTLLADGEKVGTVTLDAGNGWTGSVADLPVNAVGKAIAYTWDEGNVEGYSLSGSVTSGTNTVLTNTHETASTVATVTKVWLDDDNRDGIRPASVVMTLSDGTKVTLDESNNWTATVENLPKYKDGQEIAYTWTEGNIEGYEQTGIGTAGTVTTITNAHSIETTSATVAKVWDDDNDRDGIRPASVVMTLSDGTKVTLDEGNNWTATVDGLPKNEDGQEIAYTWTEDAVEGYEQTGSETVGTVTTVTNTHAAAKQNLSVTKVWDDGSDQDGVRPASLTVTLLADGEKVGTVTLDAGNGWTGSVADLPVNAVGKAIAYTWDEGNVEGYSLSGSVTSGTNTVLTNSHKTEVTLATVTKVWLDDDNRDGIRPKSVVMTLSNGTEVTLDKDNNWTATVENLPKYKDGQEIAYTWTECAVEEYEQTSNETVGTVTTITNTHSIATKSVTVVKIWDDGDNKDSIRPASVMVTVNGGDVTQSVELKEENGWTATVEGLPVHRHIGGIIGYEWSETVVPPGYTLMPRKVEGDVTTLTNVHEIEMRPLTVQKVWDDKDNQDGKRPKEVTVILKADGTEIDRFKLNDGNKWTAATEPLPVSADGKEISYTWSEEKVPAGYTLTVKHDPSTGKTVLTNTHKPETIRLTVKKEWKDSNSSKRPTSVTVYLVSGKEQTRYTLSQKENWTRTVEVPRYQDGKEIRYSWKESSVSGYSTSVKTQGNVTTITNTRKSSGGGGGGGTPKTYTLTIKYVYEDGKTASKTYTATYQKGKTYSVTSPVIDGYTASEKTVKGTMPAENVTLTVTYTRNAEPTADPDTPLGFGVIYFNVGDCLE